MPTPIREQLIDAIRSQVGGVYAVDTTLALAQAPITVVAEDAETAAENEYGVTEIELPIAVARAEEATDSVDLNAMRVQANEILAGIIADVFAGGDFSGLARSTVYTGGGIQIEAGRLCAAEAQFNIRYTIAYGDPFNTE